MDRSMRFGSRGELVLSQLAKWIIILVIFGILLTITLMWRGSLSSLTDYILDKMSVF